MKKGETSIRAGESLFREGMQSQHIYTLLDGWGIRYNTMADDRRQTLNFVFPGDLIGLRGSLIEDMGHAIDGLSDMLLCVFDRGAVNEIISTMPDLAFDLVWMAAREEQMIEEHLLSVGRRTATERMAYMLSLLHQRAVTTGLIHEGGGL